MIIIIIIYIVITVKYRNVTAATVKANLTIVRCVWYAHMCGGKIMT